MSITHCPSCREPLSTLNGAGVCINVHCNDGTLHVDFVHPSAQQCSGSCVAAPAEAVQGEGAPSPKLPNVADFRAWLWFRRDALENEAFFNRSSDLDSLRQSIALLAGASDLVDEFLFGSSTDQPEFGFDRFAAIAKHQGVQA